MSWNWIILVHIFEVGHIEFKWRGRQCLCRVESGGVSTN